MTDLKPNDCTSLNCQSWGSDYCTECSHARFFGEGVSRTGRLWRWEFNPYFGPLFLTAKGEPMAYQPVDEDHQAWEPFEKWHKEFFGGNNDRS